MNFENPVALLLFSLLILLGFLWPRFCGAFPPRTTVRSVLSVPLRLVILLLLACALARPSVRLKLGAATLWLIVDRSASAASEVQSHLSEWETIIERSRPPSGKLKVLDVAEEVWPRNAGEQQRTVATSQTRIGSALRYVLGRTNDGGRHRILVISDGYATDPLDGVSELITERGIPVDLRLTRQIAQKDVRLNRLIVPTRVLADEPFVIEFEITGSTAKAVPYSIFRNGRILHRGSSTLDKGKSVIRFTDSLPKAAQMHQYRVEIDPENDQFTENNAATAITAVDGPPAVLVLSSVDNDPIVHVLEEAGMATRHPNPSASLDSTTLGGVNTVILNNIHASSLSSEFLKILKVFVEAQGGGLVMVGGPQSFGTGGYFGTAIDPILPVSVELQEEQRKQPVAFSFVLDRSGSMMAGVEGNLGNLTKMDLANEGTARAISMLSGRDEVGIIAVDSAATVVVPLREIGNDDELDLLLRKARSISSGGGGIFVFEGLQSGWKQLESSKKTTRHTILFADAADAEEPGSYKELLKTITTTGGTVSVIALGNRSDPDAGLLEEIAALGKGRAFFVDNAVDLPAVFSQETVAVARAQYVSKETPLTFTDGWSAIAQDTIRLPTFVDGYNRTFLRPEASSALVSLDEDKVPLLASWQKGLGRVVAIPFPLAGDQASIVRQWNQYGAFVRTIVQWVRRPQAPAGLSVTAEQIGNTAQIVLRYSPEWEREVGIKAPQAVIASSQSKDPQETAWSRVGPGLFTLTRELLPGEIIHGATKVDEYTIPFGPLTNPRSPEYDFDPEQYRALKQLSRISGGKERISLDGIWDNVDEFSWHSLQSWCIGLALVLLLLEVLLSRLIGNVVMARAGPPEAGLWRRNGTWSVTQRSAKFRRKVEKKKLTDGNVHESEPGIASPGSSPLDLPEKEKMISAFEKAKRRGV